MPVPPAEIPENASAEDYNILAMLYGTMGKTRMAMEASKRAAQLVPPPKFSPEALPDLPPEEAAKVAAEGQDIAMQLMNLMVGPSDTKLTPEEQADKMMALMAQMRDLAVRTGANDDDLQKFDEGLGGLFTALTQEPEMPPRTVPEGLSAQEYLELGQRYKTVGWTEQSRDALQYAMELDPDGENGVAALAFMRSKLPRHPVPLSAEQANIQGFNLMVSGDLDGAVAVFEKLIREFPDFEWPQGNLGSIRIEEGDFAEAERILIAAVQLNPFYLNGWAHLCRANLLQSKYKEARYAVERIRKIDPKDEQCQRLAERIDTVQRWEENGGKFE